VPGGGAVDLLLRRVPSGTWATGAERAAQPPES
jgi:hypothetical protein